MDRAGSKKPARLGSIVLLASERRYRLIDRLAEFSHAFGKDANGNALSFLSIDLVFANGYEF